MRSVSAALRVWVERMVNDPGLVAIHQNGIVTGTAPIVLLATKTVPPPCEQRLSRPVNIRTAADSLARPQSCTCFPTCRPVKSCEQNR